MKVETTCAFLLATMLSTGAIGGQERGLPPWVGVWAGTIGKSRVVACFDYRGKPLPSGSYYYLRHLTPIPLMVAIDPDHVVHEMGQVVATWSLDSVSAKSMTGHWTKKGDSSSLPIRLTLVPGSRKGIYDPTDSQVYNSRCSSDFYNARLEAPPSTKIDNTFEANGRSYKNLSASSAGYDLEWFQLDGTGKAADAINQTLRENVPESNEEWRELFKCRRMLLAQTGDSGHAGKKTAFVLSTNNLLVAVNIKVEHCNHVSMWRDPYLLLSFETGNEVSLWPWIKDARPCPRYSGGMCPSENLGKLIRAKRVDAKQDPSCTPDDGNGPHEVELSLEPEGFLFTTKPDGRDSDCKISYLASFQDLSPFLTDQGKAEVRSISAEHKKDTFETTGRRP